jgi:hypothetical protein
MFFAAAPSFLGGVIQTTHPESPHHPLTLTLSLSRSAQLRGSPPSYFPSSFLFAADAYIRLSLSLRASPADKSIIAQLISNALDHRGTRTSLLVRNFPDTMKGPKANVENFLPQSGLSLFHRVRLYLSTFFYSHQKQEDK